MAASFADLVAGTVVGGFPEFVIALAVYNELSENVNLTQYSCSIDNRFVLYNSKLHKSLEFKMGTENKCKITCEIDIATK